MVLLPFAVPVPPSAITSAGVQLRSTVMAASFSAKSRRRLPLMTAAGTRWHAFLDLSRQTIEWMGQKV
jgi:hypothetical protein